MQAVAGQQAETSGISADSDAMRDRIEAIEMIPLAAALGADAGYGSAREIAHRRAATLVKLRLSSGVVGIGECFGPPELTMAYLPIIREAYLGRRLVDHKWLWRRMTDRLYHVRAQSQLGAAVSGLDIAIHDALGKLMDLPLYRLLGGEPCEAMPVYASGGYFNEEKAPSLASQLEAVAGRFGAYKIKIGMGLQSDIARTAQAREIIGDDALLMVDINGGYTLDDALATMNALAPFGVHWVEEPLAPEDLDGYRRLAGRSPLRIAAGEACVTAPEFRELAATGSVDVLMPDLNMCGGFVEGLRIADLALLSGLKVSPHVWGSAVGMAAALHFAAALPTSPHITRRVTDNWVEHDVSDNPLARDLLTLPLPVDNGQMALPAGPGLGIELDEAAVQRLTLG